ncbi:MAG: hypothetical protein WDN69_03805 [Aliidongia sp.]
MLVTLADEAVESLLLTVDALIDAADRPCRSEAAALLRETAEECGNTARAARLAAAAAAVDAGMPCALMVAGVDWRGAVAEAAAAPQVWQDRLEAASPPDPEPELPPPVILGEQPRLPRLRLRYFFPGLVVRLRRPVLDRDGQEAPVGQRLTLRRLAIEGEAGAAVYHLQFEERGFRLDVLPQDDRSIIGNGGNGWFQPVPERDALAELSELLDRRLYEAERAVEEDDDPNQIDADMLLTLRTDLDECGDWLQGDGAAPAPRLLCAPVAAEYFGKGSDMADWFALLFAAILQCKRA